MFKRIFNNIIKRSNKTPKHIKIDTSVNLDAYISEYEHIIELYFGRECVVIIDDNTEVQHIIRRCLSECNHTMEQFFEYITDYEDKTDRSFDVLFIKYIRKCIIQYIMQKNYDMINIYKYCFIMLGDHLIYERSYLEYYFNSNEIDVNLPWYNRLHQNESIQPDPKLIRVV